MWTKPGSKQLINCVYLTELVMRQNDLFYVGLGQIVNHN